MLPACLVVAAAAVALAAPASASTADATAAPCHPSHDPLMECVRKTLESITICGTCLPDPHAICQELIAGCGPTGATEVGAS